MSNAAQKRAIESYRARLTQRGFKRFEVLALESDRELIRSLARQLAEDGPEAEEARQTVKALVGGAPRKPGGILASLRRSPLVGADLDLVGGRPSPWSALALPTHPLRAGRPRNAPLRGRVQTGFP
jgi:hypothetical protein